MGWGEGWGGGGRTLGGWWRGGWVARGGGGWGVAGRRAPPLRAGRGGGGGGGGGASRRAMYRGWPARYAGPPRLGLLFGAVEVHLALGPLLLLGAGPLGIQKGLRSLGDSRTIG